MPFFGQHKGGCYPLRKSNIIWSSVGLALNFFTFILIPFFICGIYGSVKRHVKCTQVAAISYWCVAPFHLLMGMLILTIGPVRYAMSTGGLIFWIVYLVIVFVQNSFMADFMTSLWFVLEAGGTGDEFLAVKDIKKGPKELEEQASRERDTASEVSGAEDA